MMTSAVNTEYCQLTSIARRDGLSGIKGDSFDSWSIRYQRMTGDKHANQSGISEWSLDSYNTSGCT